MKWFVAGLLTLNLCLAWMAGYFESPSTQLLRNGQGKLPRVSDLRVESMPFNDAPKRLGGASLNINSRNCGRITGFGARAIAEQFAATNRALFHNVRIDADMGGSNGYSWVIVPPFDERKKALDVLAQLQRAGVDSYLVTEGEYRLAISLGLFESRRYAQSLNARFQKQNIETVLVNLPKDQLSYALAFEAAKQVGRPTIVARLKRYGHRLEVARFQPCEGVATSAESP